VTKLPLPDSSFVSVTTRRLARPMLLWQDERATAMGFDPERVFCCPVASDAPEAYADETRVEQADRYGGFGLGQAGGSGRCSVYGGLQTKGVGVTPLVTPVRNEWYTSGTLPVESAVLEALFAQVYQAALPFGAVPTLAVLLTQPPASGVATRTARALAIRPFVLRPAHFMRNLLHPSERLPQGLLAPGLTRDAFRVQQALGQLANGLGASLDLSPRGGSEADVIDHGLRELARRMAWQFAAGFAKRLPHGTISPSNLALSSQYLDFGLSRFERVYRRRHLDVQEPGAESHFGLQTLLTLRQQLDKYHPGLRGAVITPDALSQLFSTTMEERLTVELGRMAGLTEDLAQACPKPLLQSWTKVMLDIRRRGAKDEPSAASGGCTPQLSTWGVNPNRPDFSVVLTLAAPHGTAEAMARAVAPHLADENLRSRFVAAAVETRQALCHSLEFQACDLTRYLSMQARRKNAPLTELETDGHFPIPLIADIEAHGYAADELRQRLSGAIENARATLSDLAPDIPGTNGLEQLRQLGQRVEMPIPPDHSPPPCQDGQQPFRFDAVKGSARATQPDGKRILLICDYFGRWPAWIDLFLRSCAHNPSIDWLIHTDCPLPEVRPVNVRFVQMSLGDYCSFVAQRLDLKFSPYRYRPNRPAAPIYTNLADLRPCYGELHAEAIEGYDYFGWCDIDLVFGNLSHFLTPELLSKDLITFDKSLCVGHFTLLRNDARMRQVYRDIPQWRNRIEGRKRETPWDDSLDEAWLSRLCSPLHTSFRRDALENGVAPEAIDRYRQNNAFISEWVTPFTPEGWLDGSRLPPEVWYWRAGELTNWRDASRQFPYLHFMNFKAHRYVDESLFSMQETWTGPAYVSKDARQADVVRIDRTGIVGMSDAMAKADLSRLQDCRRLASETSIEGLSAQQAVHALRSAGVSWSQGRLIDRAGVLPEAHRKTLWHERQSQA